MTAALRKQLLESLKTLEQELVVKGTRKLEPTKTDDVEKPDEEDDQPLVEMLQSIASNRNAHDASMLKRVRVAIHRLGTEPEDFGNCQDCGDEIPFARLKAMPYAELCVECQTKADPRGGRATRKKLTDYQ